MNYKKGQKVILCKDTSTGSRFCAPIGTVLYIVNKNNTCGCTGYNVSYDKNALSAVGYVYEIELRAFAATIADMVKVITELEKDIIEKQKEIEDYKLRIKFIETCGLETFDEEEFKAYEVLKIIGVDDIEKARSVIKILNR
jgi:hypothetical protein